MMCTMQSAIYQEKYSAILYDADLVPRPNSQWARWSYLKTLNKTIRCVRISDFDIHAPTDRHRHVAGAHERLPINITNAMHHWQHKMLTALSQTYFQEWPKSAVCVQHSIDSRNSAIRSAYRILLRPSSLLEPRHPSLKVVKETFSFSIRSKAAKNRG